MAERAVTKEDQEADDVTVDLSYVNAEVVDGDGLTWDQLIEVPRIGPKTIENIKRFIAQEDPFRLEWIFQVMKQLRENLGPGNDFGLPTPTHVSSSIPRQGVHKDICWVGIPRKKKFGDYIEDERSRKGLELDEIRANMKDPHLSRRCYIEAYDDYDETVRLRFNRWRYPDFAQELEELRVDGSEAVVALGMKRQDFGVSLHVQDFWVISLE